MQSTPGVALPDFDLQRFFNVANCNCNLPVSVFFTFSQSGFAKKPTLPDGNIEFWAGLNCNNVTVRNCTKLGDTLTLTTFGAKSGIVVTTDIADAESELRPAGGDAERPRSETAAW